MYTEFKKKFHDASRALTLVEIMLKIIYFKNMPRALLFATNA